MASPVEISIKTDGAYTRNNDMQLIDVKRPTLNCKPKARDIATRIYLDKYEYEDSGNEEKHMDSLLDHIATKIQDVKTQFVTTKQLLALVACGKLEKAIIVPYLDAIFILPMEIDKKTAGEEIASKYRLAGNFQHFMTKGSEDEPIKTDRNSYKAVLKASIKAGEDVYSILYSGEIDALDAENEEHIELKLICNGLDNEQFWQERCQWVYWQAYFANVQTILVGHWIEEKNSSGTMTNSYTGKPFSPKLSKVEVLDRESILRGPSVNNIPRLLWNVENGRNDVRDFFQQVKDECTGKRVCYVATKSWRKNWTITAVDEKHECKDEVEAFRKVLQQKLGSDEKKLMNELGAEKTDQKQIKNVEEQKKVIQKKKSKKHRKY